MEPLPTWQPHMAPTWRLYMAHLHGPLPIWSPCPYGTFTWHPHTASSHGTLTQHHLTHLHGTLTWHLYMAPLHGALIWHSRMPRHPRLKSLPKWHLCPWHPHMEPTHKAPSHGNLTSHPCGAFTWHPYFTWNPCMAPSHDLHTALSHGTTPSNKVIAHMTPSHGTLAHMAPVWHLPMARHPPTKLLPTPSSHWN